MPREIRPKLITTDFSLAIVVSQFNTDITEALLQGALDRLQELHFPDSSITVVHVPGAVEIPLTCQHLARTQNFKAIIALGAVIQGDSKHFDYVCEQVSQGCQHVSLSENIPVIFGILTTLNKQQAWDRVTGPEGHYGRDAVDTALQMVDLLKIHGN